MGTKLGAPSTVVIKRKTNSARATVLKNEMFSFLFDLAFTFLAGSVVTTAFLHYEERDGDYIYDSECVKWITNFESVSLVFCGSQPEQVFIKEVMKQGVPTSVMYNYVLPNVSMKISGHLDFMVIVNGISVEEIQSCLSHYFMPHTFIYRARIIICDINDTRNKTLKELPPPEISAIPECLGDASALLLSGGDCWYLTPPYLPDRRFLQASSCQDHIPWVMPREEVLDLQGNTLDVVTFHRPITTIINFNETDPDRRYDGIEVNIFRLIARKMNFKWKIDELEGQADKFGHFSEGKWTGGVMGAMTRPGGAEIGFATLWMSTNQTTYVDFTLSWMMMEQVFLVPRPKLDTASWDNLFRPLSTPVWLLIIFSMTIFPLTVRTMLQLYLRINNLNKKSGISLVECYLYAWGTVTGGSWRLSVYPPLTLRPMFFAWSAGLVFLCCCYTSNIAAELSLPTYTPTINTVRQLVEQGFSWGTPYPEDNLEQFLDFKKYWHKRFADHFILYDESEEKSLVMGGKFAYLAQNLDETHYLVLETDIDEEEASLLRVLGEPLRAYRCAIATRKNSPLLTSIDRVIHRLFETGLAMFYKNDAVRRFQNFTLERIYHDDDTAEFNADVQASLTMKAFRPVFYALFFGWVLSTLVFLGELYFSCIAH